MLGHSAGGIAALSALNANSPLLPNRLVTIVTYGSNALSNNTITTPLPPRKGAKNRCLTTSKNLNSYSDSATPEIVLGFAPAAVGFN